MSHDWVEEWSEYRLLSEDCGMKARPSSKGLDEKGKNTEQRVPVGVKGKNPL